MAFFQKCLESGIWNYVNMCSNLPIQENIRQWENLVHLPIWWVRRDESIEQSKIKWLHTSRLQTEMLSKGKWCCPESTKDKKGNGRKECHQIAHFYRFILSLSLSKNSLTQQCQLCIIIMMNIIIIIIITIIITTVDKLIPDAQQITTAKRAYATSPGLYTHK